MIEDYSKLIINGMVRYMRLLGAAPDMELHTGDVEWIMPKTECKGPSIVYHVELDVQSAPCRLDKMVDDIMMDKMPSVWFIPPDSTPPDLIEMLKLRKFRNISDPERPEYGMALEMDDALLCPETPGEISIRRVGTSAEFELWVDIVNEALHGWPMIDAGGYKHMLADSDVALYLSYVGDVPAGTSATIMSGSSATIEFVSTLEQFRCRGAATAVCRHALKALRNDGVRVVTLRAEYDAVGIYKKIGFREVFETVVMKM